MMIDKSFAEFYMMTGKFSSHDDFSSKLTQALSHSNKVVQLKNKMLSNENDYLELAKIAETLCHQSRSTLLLATSVDIFNQTNAHGLHLNSSVLFEYESRPIANNKLLSISCHTTEEMEQAQKLGVNLLLLSPVKATASHPELKGIGWEQFSKMIKQVKCPVYALGGMQVSDLDDAKQAGAQGVAVSSLWK